MARTAVCSSVAVPPPAAIASSVVAFSVRRARVFTTIMRGDSSLPVLLAGQTAVHRPHSVHE